MIRVGLDTNVLAYLAGVNRSDSDAFKIEVARQLLNALNGRATLVAPTQTLGELFSVLTRTGATRDEARAVVSRFQATFEVAEAGRATLQAAMDLAVVGRLQIWDALILNAAAESGCVILLTEDMQDGFVWRGLTLVNPFRQPQNPRLAALLVDP